MPSNVSRRSMGLLIGSITVALLVAASTVALAGRAAPLRIEAAVRPQGVNVPGCTLTGPRQGLELNTVAAASLFKSIAMEKEIFACRNTSNQITQFRDVETFIEIVQNQAGTLIEAPRVEIATCIKSVVQGTVACRTAPMPLGPAEKQPLLGCRADTQQTPDDPVVMTSAVIGRVVKTIKVEKEWFTCDTAAAGLRIRDIYIFTEIMEKAQVIPGTNTTTLRPFLHRFLGIVCTKDEVKGQITGCSRFPTS